MYIAARARLLPFTADVIQQFVQTIVCGNTLRFAFQRWLDRIGHHFTEFNPELVRLQSRKLEDADGEKDELFDKGVEIVLASQRGSVSLLQRRLQVGYSRASRIIDQMAAAGLLGEYKGSQARECFMTLEEWEGLQEAIVTDQSGEAALDGTPTSS